MLREIITPQSDEYMIHIPKEYINTKVEILVLPFAYANEKTIQKSKNKSKISLSGVYGISKIDISNQLLALISFENIMVSNLKVKIWILLIVSFVLILIIGG